MKGKARAVILIICVLLALSVASFVGCIVGIKTAMNSLGEGILHRMDKLEKEDKKWKESTGKIIDESLKKLNDYVDPNNEDRMIEKSIREDYKKLRGMIRTNTIKVAKDFKRIHKIDLPPVSNKLVDQVTSRWMANWLITEIPFTAAVAFTNHESGFHPFVPGPKQEQGLLQLWGCKEKLDWKESLKRGFNELNGLWVDFDGNLRDVARRYNGGRGVDRVGNPKALANVERYYKHIVAMQKIIQKRFGGIG
jgi:hypothetical protein